MDGELRITTSVVNGDATLGQLKNMQAQLRAARNEMVPGTQAAKENAEALNQVNLAIKQAGPNWTAYTQNIKQARMEHRLMAFAAVELMHGFQGVSGAIVELTGGTAKQAENMNKTTQSITGALGAAMGTKFAIGMLGESFSALAGPAGIVVGVVTVLGSFVGRLNEIKQHAAELMAMSNATSDQQIASQLAGASPEVVQQMLNNLKSKRPQGFTKTGIGILDSAAPPRNDALEVLISGYEKYLAKLKEDIALQKSKVELMKESAKLDPANQYSDANKRFQRLMELQRGGGMGQLAPTTIAGLSMSQGGNIVGRLFETTANRFRCP